MHRATSPTAFMRHGRARSWPPEHCNIAVYPTGPRSSGHSKITDQIQ
jgi:hypothetical protein